ncbi:hypothetical protein E3N88_29218 [Mikania micrantha]|uniref:Uncharacterized protein n=1 Tax=Mikania micrantha TaxID=192012 RepID=A0A5N6MI74_9ASTR|nr:hypothetical protein E3N88_29218 [Mikania micrantha]
MVWDSERVDIRGFRGGPEEDPDEESSNCMPPTLRAPKRPRFESDEISRLTWKAKWVDDRIEQLAQELRDANGRHVELRSIVNRMETDITQLTARVQEEEHWAEISEGRLIELEELVASVFEEEEEEEVPAQDADADSDADSTIEDA